MKSLQSFMKRHPFIFAITALFVSRIAGMATIGLVQLFNPELTIQSNLGWLLMAVYASVVVSLVYWSDTAKEIGLTLPPSRKEWLLSLPLLSLPILILCLNGVASWGTAQNIALAIAAVGVAVNEEVLFRGILMRGFMKWGAWIAILVPSALFALAHSTNVFVGGDPTYAVFQTIWTFAAGVCLSAFRLRTQSLYPVIILHVLLDAVEYFSTGNYGVHPDGYPIFWLTLLALLNVALAVYGVLLVKRQLAKSRNTLLSA